MYCLRQTFIQQPIIYGGGYLQSYRFLVSSAEEQVADKDTDNHKRCCQNKRHKNSDVKKKCNIWNSFHNFAEQKKQE